jgi:signal transduction histidine kinase
MHQFGILMRDTDNLPKEIEYLKKALLLARQVNSIDRQMISNSNLGSAFLRKGMPDSALYHAQQSDSCALLPGFKGVFGGRNKALMGDVYFKQGDYRQAKLLYLKGLDLSIKTNNQFNIAIAKHKLSQLYLKIKQNDSALFYAKDNLSSMYLVKQNFANFQLNLGTLYEDIFFAYKQNNQQDSAYKYLLITSQIKDSLYKVRIANLSAFQNVSFEETLRLESLESEQLQTESKIRIYSLLAGLMVVSVIGIILFRNNNQRKKSNLLLTSQKNEIEQQKKQVEESMERLQSTQSQLVQAEKMASLGELTAGIAHEIQNPLNFVNNFAEINTELIDELKKEIEPAGIISANELVEDIKANSEKITHHGNRADAIVKSMLQHSRKTSAQKELTDINALCDEYMRLFYHGLRAKDKSFNAEYDTKFDTNLPLISVIPQDIGRVILNLINNAFYAVNARQKMEQDSGYKPLVTLTTSKQGDQVVIEVADNGTGMPEQVKEKIFQPFFTTKPTGEGTGLGSSLSYDIVTKGHGGSINVSTSTNQGTVFSVQLPA